LTCPAGSSKYSTTGKNIRLILHTETSNKIYLAMAVEKLHQYMCIFNLFSADNRQKEMKVPIFKQKCIGVVEQSIFLHVCFWPNKLGDLKMH